MNTKWIQSAVKTSLIFLRKHTPEILTALGVVGMATATVTAVKATPEALKKIEEKKEELNVDKLTVGETIKTCWKCYLPTVTAVTASAACIVGASATNNRRNAALATAYTLSETAMREFSEKAEKALGEERSNDIRNEIAKERVENHPVEQQQVIVLGKDETLCYDYMADRYFTKDPDEINKAVNELARRMRYETYVSLNDFYYELGLRPTGVGDEVGWNIDKGIIDIYYSAQVATNGKPCLVLEYRVPPKANYMD